MPWLRLPCRHLCCLPFEHCLVYFVFWEEEEGTRIKDRIWLCLAWAGPALPPACLCHFPYLPNTFAVAWHACVTLPCITCFFFCFPYVCCFFTFPPPLLCLCFPYLPACRLCYCTYFSVCVYNTQHLPYLPIYFTHTCHPLYSFAYYPLLPHPTYPHPQLYTLPHFLLLPQCNTL